MSTVLDAHGDARYTPVAILLHWLTVVLVFVLLGLGWYLDELPKGPVRGWWIGLHKSIGIILFSVMLVRSLWRLSHAPPVMPDPVPVWQAKLSAAVHGTLYLLLFVQPLSGYLSASFSGYPMLWFGWPLYDWGWKDSGLNELFSEIHAGSSIALTVLIGLHVVAAAYHALWRKDVVVRRMLPPLV